MNKKQKHIFHNSQIILKILQIMIQMNYKIIFRTFIKIKLLKIFKNLNKIQTKKFNNLSLIKN